MNRAWLVGLGIFSSRLAGLVRLRFFAHYFGLRSEAADAFNAAFRIPNLLQNLFGEGALSGSFIPVYTGLVARGRHADAEHVARATATLLALLLAVLVAVGVACAPWLVSVLAPGFAGEQRALTVVLVRTLFPGAGLLVLSAWCLGVLNSHRRFLLSYAAPVVWNAAMIAVLVWRGPHVDATRLAVALAWGSVVGSALQLVVQLPAVARFVDLRAAWDVASEHVRTVARNFVPVVLSRGVVQVSAYVDTVIGSLLPTGAVTGLTNAQIIYTLLVSLFGISLAASELPEMADAASAGPEAAGRIGDRLRAASRRVVVLVAPSVVAFVAFGDTIAAALLQTGRFTSADADLVWGILAGSAVGLLPTTLGRLYASTSYALGDPRTPLRFAVVRVALATVLGYAAALYLPATAGVAPIWGAAALTFTSGLCGWIELVLLRNALAGRVGPTRLEPAYVARVWMAALAAAGAAYALKRITMSWHPVVAAAAILGPFGLGYFALAALFGVPELRQLGIGRRLRR